MNNKLDVNEDTTVEELALLLIQFASVVRQKTHPRIDRPIGPLNLLRYNVRRAIETFCNEPDIVDPATLDAERLMADARELLAVASDALAADGDGDDQVEAIRKATEAPD